MHRSALALLFVLLLAATPVARGAGFAVTDQGAKAMGMAGAFTAVADDPSAVYYNAGALAFFEHGSVAAGVVAERLNNSQLRGLAPGLGAGETGEQETDLLYPSLHAAWVQPLRPGMTFALGVHTPFHLSTDWKDPDGFPGRSLALSSEIRTLDANPTLAFRVGGSLGVGVGVVARSTDVATTRRLQRPDPLRPNADPLDVALLTADTDVETGLGWNFGLLHRPTCCLAWGLSYRSGIDVDYAGSAVLTQVPTGNVQFDELIAASLPIGDELALSTAIDFPAVARAGVAFRVSPALRFALDLDWTEWSRVQRISFVVPDEPELGNDVELLLDDAMGVHLGLLWESRTGTRVTAGVGFEESPQPSSTVGPFLPDAERTVVAVGWGKDWLDVALSWVQLADRTVRDSVENLNGTWSGDSLRLGLTVRVGALAAKPEAPSPPKLPKPPV